MPYFIAQPRLPDLPLRQDSMAAELIDPSLNVWITPKHTVIMPLLETLY